MASGNSWSAFGDGFYLGLRAAVDVTTKLAGLMPSVVLGGSWCWGRGELTVTSLSRSCLCQQLYQIQQVTMPAGQDIAQPMFIQSTNQPSDGQATQVTGD